jgi:hypothetical protein
MKNTIEKRFAEARALLELTSNNEEILSTVEIYQNHYFSLR